MIGSSPVTFVINILLHIGAAATAAVFILPHFQWYHSLIFSLLLFSSLYFLLRAALTDPGIIPPCPPAPNEEFVPQPPDMPDVDGGPLHFCDTCHQFRPPRAKHCRYCDVCVKTFDHHCAYVSTCIGERNYRYFFFFVVSVVALASHVLTLCCFWLRTLSIDEMREHEDEEGEGEDESWLHAVSQAFNRSPATVALACFCLAVFFSVSALLLYHCSLLRKGETTNESIRGTYKRHINRSDHGFWRNMKSRLCGPVPRSELDFLREEVGAEAFQWGLEGMARDMETIRRRRMFANEEELRGYQTDHLSASAINLPPSSNNTESQRMNEQGRVNSPPPAAAAVPALQPPHRTLSGDGEDVQVHFVYGGGPGPMSNNSTAQDLRLDTQPLASHPDQEWNSTSGMTYGTTGNSESVRNSAASSPNNTLRRSPSPSSSTSNQHTGYDTLPNAQSFSCYQFDPDGSDVEGMDDVTSTTRASLLSSQH